MRTLRIMLLFPELRLPPKDFVSSAFSRRWHASRIPSQRSTREPHFVEAVAQRRSDLLKLNLIRQSADDKDSG